MEILFAAIAIPCLVFAFCDYLYHFWQNWLAASAIDNNEWKPRKDDKDYETFN